MATKKHRKGWITGAEPGLWLIHAPTPSLLLSFWSFPRLSTSPRGQDLAHTPVLPCAVQESSTSASPASPRERPALGLGSTKPKINTLEIASCTLWPQTSFSLWELKQFGLSPPHSLLPCLHPRASSAQTAPKLSQGVKLLSQHRPRGPFLLPSHFLETSQRMSQQAEEPGPFSPLSLTSLLPCPHRGCAGEGKPRDTQAENLSPCQAELCTLSIPTPPVLPGNGVRSLLAKR